MLQSQNTVCRLCSACCPVKVESKNGRLLRATRKSVYPELARPCPKLTAAAEIIYAPERLQLPLIRKNRKSASFSPISWEQAYDFAATQMLQLKEESGAQSVAWLRGMAADWGVPWDYANRLMHAFGSPNTIGNGSVCHVAREMANIYTCGAMPAANPQKSECILVWGKNDLDTAPGAGEAILAALARGAKLIVVDPVRTELAERADVWLPIRPAHDALLAMALIHEIISKKLYDQKFIETYGLGFKELKKTAANFSASQIAAECWLKPAEIEAAARLYATTKPACLIEGNGLDMQLETFQATRAVSMLRALTGNLDRPGGDLIPHPLKLRNLQLRERLPQNVRAITAAYPLFDNFHETWGRHAQSALIDSILEEKPYPVRGLIVQSGNPAVTMTDSGRVRKALKKLDFLMVIDLFQTKTCDFADLILPAASCFEETQLNRAYTRNNPCILQNQVVEAYGQSRPDWQIIFELARYLGLKEEFPWKDVEEALDYQLAPSGLNVAKLREHPEGLRAEALRYEKYREDGFATPSGKIEFYCERLKQAGFDPVPLANKKWQNPLSFSRELDDDALVAISGPRLNTFTHTQFRQIEALRRPENEAVIEISAAEARARKLHEGQMVTLQTPRGEVSMPLRISSRARPGIVIIAWGWGEVEEHLNLNNLTDDKRRDPVTATPANRGFMCHIVN